MEEMILGVSKGNARTPLTRKLRLDNDEAPAMDEREYLSILGKVSFEASSTRPDLSWAHSWLSSGSKTRTFQMKQEAEHTLRYMRSTTGWGLLYHSGEDALKLTMYVDASYSQGEHYCSGWVAVEGKVAES